MNRLLARYVPIVLAAILASSCRAAPSQPIVPALAVVTPTGISTFAPLNFEPIGNAIGISVYGQGERIEAGKVATIKIVFQPLNLLVSRRSDGSIEATSSSPWTTPHVTEMQTCTGFDAPCELTGKWIPFTREQEMRLEVDWIGAREFWLRAQFRDGAGAIVPAFNPSSYDLPKNSAQTSARLVAVFDERTPLATFPVKIQTLVAATRLAFPVSGFVRFENNRTIIGGKAGSTVEVKAQFGATSPLGEVKEMRVRDFRSRQCASQSQMDEATWEPFVAEKTYKIGVAINFTSFDVSAQYRDMKGNLSQIYCADLAVEGSP